MVEAFADFHVHIGRSFDAPVKITAAKSLTLDALVRHARVRKGLDVITVIDGVCDGPLTELEAWVDTGVAKKLPGGGLQHENGLVMLIGAEIEVAGPYGGAAHFGCWFPDTVTARDFLDWLKTVQRNTTLSSQRARVDAVTLQSETSTRDGMFVIHHAFTPHKGMYGNCVSHMAEMVDPSQVDALELGLSSDTEMADRVAELQEVTFLTNSDAHSIQKVAREYNQIALGQVDFTHIRKAMARMDGNRLMANYGLHPRLGKYHTTACAVCGRPLQGDDTVCACGSRRIVTGVSARLDQIATWDEPRHPAHRPPYVRQVPLEFIPGVGPKTMERLYESCGTEMDILHRAPVESLVEAVGTPLANEIDRARRGHIDIEAGSGGVYGKVLTSGQEHANR